MQDKIREIINNFCDDLSSFTSLDVSNAVKQGGFPDSRHRDVAPVVRQIFADGELDDFDYTRTLIDVELLSGLKTKTNLYHHVSISTDSYLDRKQVAITPKKLDSAPAPKCWPILPPPPPPAPAIFNFNPGDDPEQNDSDDQDIDSNEIECYCKSDGRLEIPVEWIRDTWNSGFEVKFILEDDMIVVFVGDLDKGEVLLGKMTISSDMRVRIPKTVFMKAGFDYSAKSPHLIRCGAECFIIEDSK